MWWVGNDISKIIEQGLLATVNAGASAFKEDELNALTGAADDNAYRLVKMKLEEVRSVRDDAHFTYLLGKKRDGTVFFFADSEPIDSENYSAFDDVYPDATKAVHQAFVDGKSFIEGPETDQWGTWISAFSPIFDADGSVFALLGMDVDILDWRLTIIKYQFLPAIATFFLLVVVFSLAYFLKKYRVMIQHLRDSREMLSTIYDNLPIGVLLLDPNGHTVRLISDRARKIMGLSATLSCPDFKSCIVGAGIVHDSGGVYEMEELPVSIALQSGSVAVKDDMRVIVDGVAKPVRMVAAPVFKDDGTISTILLVIEDMTLDKEIKAIKNEFISLASHQLATPLAAIKWTIDMLLDSDLTERQHNHVARIKESNDRLLVLVKHLLEVSRIDSGKIILNIQDIDLAGVVRSLKQEFALAAKDQAGRIVLANGFPEKLVLKTDEEKVRHIIQNLVSNALKYSKSEESVLIDYAKEGDFAVLSVTDKGFGIPKQQQSRIFEKFFRADNVAQIKQTEGTGLGLYVAKMFAERINGSLSFVSEENKGTTFYLRLPFVSKP